MPRFKPGDSVLFKNQIVTIKKICGDWGTDHQWHDQVHYRIKHERDPNWGNEFSLIEIDSMDREAVAI